MKKAIIATLSFAAVFAFAASVALAAGGKVQGDNAQGDAFQNCARVLPGESNICPFE